TVLCADNPINPERDEALLALIPESTTVLRTIDHDRLTWLQRLRGAPESPGAPAAAAPGTSAPAPATAAPESAWTRFKRSLAFRLRPPSRVPGWYRSAVRGARRALRAHRSDAIYSSGPPWTSHLIAARLASEFKLPWVADFR